MNKSISIFLPVRNGSERVESKNTRQFSVFKDGLLELKLNQLVQIDGINEIVVSTNDNDCKRIAKRFKIQFPKIIIDVRPEFLSSSKTSLTDLVRYVPRITKFEHIIWTHVTSPFFDEKLYSKSIEQYFAALSNGYDSLMSVLPFRNFLWSNHKNDIINRVGNEKWPRTQDLSSLFEIDSAVFIANRQTYIEKFDRIGDKPFLFENNKISSFDIDWQDDFIIAESIYERLRNNGKTN